MSLASSYLQRSTRRVAALAALAGPALIAGSVLVATPVLAQGGPKTEKSEARQTSTAILTKIYNSGNGRLAKGDVKGAASALQIVADVAPEVAEANYSLALAQILADFAKRESALSAVSRGMAADPNHPLAGITSVLANPQLSQMRSDGALYLSQEGASRLRAAAAAAQSSPSMKNGRYLNDYFSKALERTNDARFPERIAGFNRVAGQNGQIKINTAEVPFGQLFSTNVAEQTFAPYEPRIIARLDQGLTSLQSNQSSLNRIRTRLTQIRQQLATNDPTERLKVLATLDTVLAELDDVIVQNETQIASLKTIVDNIQIDQQVVAKKEELKRVEAEVAQYQKVSVAFKQQAELAQKELSEVEKKRISTVQEVNKAQKQLNQLQGQLAKTEAQLTERERQAQDAEKSVAARGNELSQLKAREDALREAQIAAQRLEALKAQQDQAAQALAKLQQAQSSGQAGLQALRQQQNESEAQRDALRRQQEEAAAQLARLQAEVKSAEASRQGNIATLRQQQAAAEAQVGAVQKQQEQAASALRKLQDDLKAAEAGRQSVEEAVRRQRAEAETQLAGLRSQIQAGEAAKRDAEKTRAELATLVSRKSSIESEMQAESAKLASIKAERDQLMTAVVELRDRQTREIAKKTQIAQRLKEVDFGRYYALVIGNDDYKEWTKLKTAVSDAKAVADVLEKKYGFKVRLITNATRSQVLNAFEDYVDELGPRDNLLVYYAGHGIVDRGFGYWVPVDGDAYVQGKTLRTQNMVKHEDVLATIQKLQVKQVMVVADSCFSGGLTNVSAVSAGPEAQQFAMRTRGIRVVDDEAGVKVGQIQGTVVKGDVPEELVAMDHWASKAARVVLTSGGNEPVVDQVDQKDKHSVFAEALLQALRKNQGLMKSIELTTAVQDRVIGKVQRAASTRGVKEYVPQTPSSNNILGYNGEFLFVARN